MNWDTCRREVLKYSRIYPSKYVMQYPSCTYRQNRFIHFLYEIFLHFLPAYLYDLVLRYQGVKPVLFKIAQRYKKAADTGEFFAMHEWNFNVTNVNDLINEIGDTDDGHEFACDVTCFNWDEYLKNYVCGIRKYILKDSEITLNSARHKIKKFVFLYLNCFVFCVRVF